MTGWPTCPLLPASYLLTCWPHCTWVFRKAMQIYCGRIDEASELVDSCEYSEPRSSFLFNMIMPRCFTCDRDMRYLDITTMGHAPFFMDLSSSQACDMGAHRCFKMTYSCFFSQSYRRFDVLFSKFKARIIISIVNLHESCRLVKKKMVSITFKRNVITQQKYIDVLKMYKYKNVSSTFY